ncbi:DUF1450 domain-containing protein [Bacillus alkalicellulosilyticus]|uniref:DUF1450 domain-containing protein n=1 Tax=Alkalihalobacterium alkalicellulosilyticum TaxID=1912214 RepID=UPI0009968969|nr:DUF1450 domain-containing protein [Bacillus alkalicellulosilyticus]
MKKIVFCEHNDFKTKKVYKELKSKYSQVKISRKGCVGKCKVCKSCPFAVQDGEVVKAKSPGKLYKELASAIKSS